MLIQKRIVKRGSRHCVTSEDGSKNLGCGPSKGWAEKRLQQVEFFKRQDKSLTDEQAAQLAEQADAENPGNNRSNQYSKKSGRTELSWTQEGNMDAQVRKGLFALPPAQRIGDGRPNDILQLLRDIRQGKRAPQFEQCQTYTQAGIMSNDAGIVLKIGEDVHQVSVHMLQGGTVVSSAEQAANGMNIAFDAEEAFAEDLCAYVNGMPLPGLQSVAPLGADVQSYNDGVEFQFDDSSRFAVLVPNTMRAEAEAPEEVVTTPPTGEVVSKSEPDRNDFDQLYQQYHDMYSGQRMALGMQAWEDGDYDTAASLFEEARDGFQRSVSPNEWELLDEWAQAASERI